MITLKLLLSMYRRKRKTCPRRKQNEIVISTILWSRRLSRRRSPLRAGALEALVVPGERSRGGGFLHPGARSTANTRSRSDQDWLSGTALFRTLRTATAT